MTQSRAGAIHFEFRDLRLPGRDSGKRFPKGINYSQVETQAMLYGRRLCFLYGSSQLRQRQVVTQAIGSSMPFENAGRDSAFESADWISGKEKENDAAYKFRLFLLDGHSTFRGKLILCSC